MITFVGDTEEGMRAVRELVKFVTGPISVALDLEDRSLTILYWQAVNHGRDALEAFGDVEDGEVEQIFTEAVDGIVDGGVYNVSRRQAAEGMGGLLRKYLVAGIDDEDLRDTDRMRNDALTCQLLVEEA